jgi:hypothetical protein
VCISFVSQFTPSVSLSKRLWARIKTSVLLTSSLALSLLNHLGHGSFLLPATLPFHIWPLYCSPVPPAAGVFLPGRRQQHVGPGEWSRVENSLILQCSDDSSSLVLRGNVTRQRGSVSTRNNILEFRILNVVFFYDLNVTVTRPALSCVTDFLIISFHAAVPSHIHYGPFTRLLPMHCTVYCILYMLTTAIGRSAALS